MPNTTTIPAVSSPPRKTSTRFYVCVAILFLAAGSMQLAAGVMKTYFRKAALPLKRPLDALNQAKLLPEYAPHRIQPKLLGPEELLNLGTEEYLQWNLRELARDPSDPTAVARLFITYHTGGPGLVPHNPKECLAAGGMTLKNETLIQMSVPGPDGVEQTFPVSVLEFELPQRRAASGQSGSSGQPRLVVAYFFYVNGRYVTTRTSVRRAVSNLWDRYSYYSKIEVSFNDDSFQRLPDRADAISATRRLLRKLMPILWEDHYQDWEAIKSGAPPVILD
jgi:hypothetical protein